MIIRPLDLFLLDGARLFPLVSEALQDGIEFHLFLNDIDGGPALDGGRSTSKGTLGAFSLLVGVERVVPLLNLFLGESQQHGRTIKLRL
jgi:hypothetical protein